MVDRPAGDFTVWELTVKCPITTLVITHSNTTMLIARPILPARPGNESARPRAQPKVEALYRRLTHGRLIDHVME